MPICFCVQTDTAIIKHITAHTHDVQLCSKKQTSSFNRSKCRPSRSTTLSRVSLYTHTHTCIVTHTLICWWVRGSCSRAHRELATVNVYTCHIRSTISLLTVPLAQALPYHLQLVAVAWCMCTYMECMCVCIDMENYRLLYVRKRVLMCPLALSLSLRDGRRAKPYGGITGEEPDRRQD